MKQPSSIDESNAAYFGLPIERIAEHNKLMTSNMRDWPESLVEYCKSVFAKVGFSGDVMASAVADWMKTQEPRP